MLNVVKKGQEYHDIPLIKIGWKPSPVAKEQEFWNN
jgi:hypothetical protein